MFCFILLDRNWVYATVQVWSPGQGYLVPTCTGLEPGAIDLRPGLKPNVTD